MTLRDVVLVTHRWLGLTSSIILSIVGVTGALIFLPRSCLFRRIAGRLHETLALGAVGRWIVMVATVSAILLQLGGLYLWWKRKSVRVDASLGWRRAAFDLHHAVGFIGFVLMLVLAATGVGRAVFRSMDTGDRYRGVRSAMTRFHTAESFSTPVKVLYALGSAGFMVQGVTGVVIWWKPRRSSGSRTA